MKNIGWNPAFVLYSVQYYLDANVQAAKALGTLPATYVGFSPSGVRDGQLEVPGARADQEHPERRGISKPRFTDFTASSMSAWALLAKEATACGYNLTMECVLGKASAETSWDAGGLYAPAALDPVHPQVNKCWLVIRLTSSGWQYDQKVTNPKQGAYNCDPKNVTAVKSYQTTS